VIISDEHRYLFVEQPHTACTAIQAELQELYGGQRILEKHATYADFLRVATPDQKRYFVFSGIRDPLDEVVSLYFKYRTNHRKKYSSRYDRLTERQRQAWKFVTDEQADFGTYLRRFNRRPYDNDTIIHHRKMDQVIRFEHLQEDFSRALERIGLEQQRPLPQVNKTGERGTYLDYYPPELRGHAAWVFGPFMEKWGYALPAEWEGITVPWSARLIFRLLSPLRYVHRRYLRGTGSPIVRLRGMVRTRLRRSPSGALD
jgi:hypothetical protein